MKELMGLTITKIELNDDDDLLVVTDAAGAQQRYYADGDCCSRSWFSHINGLENLLGQPVLDVIVHEEGDSFEDEELLKQGKDAWVQIYGYTLVTAKGSCDIELRNASNGYYGGRCVPEGHYPFSDRMIAWADQESLRAIREDF